MLILIKSNYWLTEGLRNSQIRRGSNWGRTTKHELELRSTGAVADTDSTGELNEITRCYVVLRNEWFLLINNLICAEVGMEICLNVVEDNDGTISTPTTAEEIEYSYYISTIVEPYPN